MARRKLNIDFVRISHRSEYEYLYELTKKYDFTWDETILQIMSDTQNPLWILRVDWDLGTICRLRSVTACACACSSQRALYKEEFIAKLIKTQHFGAILR